MKEDVSDDDIEKELESNEKVEKMLNSWDIVKCHICKKKMSILDSKIVSNQYGEEVFIHKRGCNR